MATVSYLYTSTNAGYSFNLDTLVGGANPASGLLKISQVTDPDSNALPSLAIGATTSVAGDYQPGSTVLSQLALTPAASGAILVGNTSGVWSVQGVANGDAGKVLTVLTDSGTPTIGWSTNGTGTVSSVAASSSTGIIVSGSPITSTGTITFNLPGTGASSAVVGGDLLVGGTGAYAALAKGSNGQVLQINGSGNVVWGPAGGVGTVTSIGVSSTTGLVVTNTPVTSSGTIGVNLPGTGASNAVVAGDLLLGSTGAYAGLAKGSNGQILTVNGSGNVVWAAPATSGTVTSVAASSSTGVIVGGSPITASGTLTFNLPGTGTSSAVVAGDLLLGGAGSYAGLAKGTNGQILTVNGSGNVVWAAPATSGTVTSVGVSSSTGLIIGSSPVTSSGTITANLPGSGGSSAVVAGDLLLGGAGSYAALAKGANNSTLKVNGSGNVVWVADSALPIAANATLNSSGIVTVSNTNVTENAIIVATSRGNSTVTAANGPLTIQVTGGVGFTIAGDGSNDNGRGISYVIYSY